MKANIIMPEIHEGTEQTVKVDVSRVPEVEWHGFCAVLLPAMREYFGLDDVKGGGDDGRSYGNCAAETEG